MSGEGTFFSSFGHSSRNWTASIRRESAGIGKRAASCSMTPSWRKRKRPSVQRKAAKTIRPIWSRRVSRRTSGETTFCRSSRRSRRCRVSFCVSRTRRRSSAASRPLRTRRVPMLSSRPRDAESAETTWPPRSEILIVSPLLSTVRVPVFFCMLKAWKMSVTEKDASVPSSPMLLSPGRPERRRPDECGGCKRRERCTRPRARRSELSRTEEPAVDDGGRQEEEKEQERQKTGDGARREKPVSTGEEKGEKPAKPLPSLCQKPRVLGSFDLYVDAPRCLTLSRAGAAKPGRIPVAPAVLAVGLATPSTFLRHAPPGSQEPQGESQKKHSPGAGGEGREERLCHAGGGSIARQAASFRLPVPLLDLAPGARERIRGGNDPSESRMVRPVSDVARRDPASPLQRRRLPVQVIGLGAREREVVVDLGRVRSFPGRRLVVSNRSRKVPLFKVDVSAVQDRAIVVRSRSHGPVIGSQGALGVR